MGYEDDDEWEPHLTRRGPDAVGNTASSSPVIVNVANSSVGASGTCLSESMDLASAWHAPDGTLRKVMVGVSDGVSERASHSTPTVFSTCPTGSRTIPFNGNIVTRFDINGELMGPGAAVQLQPVIAGL